ncbi:sugar transferase [Paenibacillus cymbidii]|uniref:sugar transferase n=1 Tax=Paenibacillus cymbidii TaxID=1639034 RepID=UPI001081E8FF|nr:sugar transferase [Paenibacillus cymbidii]
MANGKRYAKWKRGFDIAAALLLLLAASPLMLAAALLIRVKLGSPVLFRQVRPGKDAAPFRLYKFRTMTDETDALGQPLPDERRLTPFGLLLRKTSVDELPQLFNVLRGDMSIVGPRPLLMRYLPFYSEREKLRFRVRPGITGLAQISGRNYLSWDERFEFDAHYVESLTLALDVKIVWLTICRVLARKQVAEAPSLLRKDLDIERGL